MVDEKSKCDWFVRLVACCQTLYFGLQCAGRLGMGLPLTTLETSTAIFAVYALIIYLLWWNKLVDVAMPIVFTINQPALDRVASLHKSSMPKTPHWKQYQDEDRGSVVDVTGLGRIPNDFSATGGHYTALHGTSTFQVYRNEFYGQYLAL
ncbi:hexose transporter hxt5 [Hypoxylon texense]